MQNSELVSCHKFDFNLSSLSDENVWITTEFRANGDPGCIFVNQIIQMQSNCNDVQLTLRTHCLTPERLRKLADELEAEMIKAKALAHEQ